MREYFESVPLYVREHDRIAGSISETPGAMPLMVEIGIAENDIYRAENPSRRGYLRGQVPEEIREYWMNRSLWGQARTQLLGEKPFRAVHEMPETAQYKFISCQGHLSPAYSEVLSLGLGQLAGKIEARIRAERDGEKLDFLHAARISIAGLSRWAARYGDYLAAEAEAAESHGRLVELREMSRICHKISTQPPATFREAMQLIWLIHQAVHIEGHGYSCTPDRLDQILLPFYEADLQAGRLDRAAALELCENFTLKQYDNSYWGPEHHLTQGLVVGGSTHSGEDRTNALSRVFLEASTNMTLPEPLVWLRWHPKIDQEFFDFALQRVARSGCFPMLWSDKVTPAGLMALGVSRQDAFNYVPVGCNELGIPGQFYFNPGANAGYLPSLQKTLAEARPGRFDTFEEFTQAFGAHLRNSIAASYSAGLKNLQAQMQWGQTPLTSCFFDECIERGQDLTRGTKYNLLSCGGTAFANAVDCLAAIREVVYEKRAASLDEVTQACGVNYQGHERLRAKLLAAPKHGNDDPRLDDVIRLVERLRDEPMKEICRDPRDGTVMGNTHVVRSSAVVQGKVTPATPDGRLAGTPLASSVAACPGCERRGPTALLNSVAKLDAAKSWQLGYQANIRFQGSMLTQPADRAKVRALLNVYFEQGGQELQINSVDSELLRAAQKNPGQYRDLVVRIAGFSEFFVNLTPEMQEDIIARTAHS
jgi:formate C-acetyltransferase